MDDATLLSRFEAAALTHEQWNHRLHVRVAYLSLRDRGFAEALGWLRSGIRAHNLANDVPDHRTSGYHETLTVAWLRVIAARERGDSLDSNAFCSDNPDLMEKSLLRQFYSRDRIGSWQAKRVFVEPDLQALPAVSERTATPE